MIVEFSVQNFRSIKEMQTISFKATGLKSNEKYSDIDINNIAIDAEIPLFKTIGIYGANASGKSNVIMALDYFIKTITSEPSSESNMSSLCDPFLYQDNYNETESYFQITLIIKNIKYRYGITVKLNNDIKKDNDSNYSREIISSEWLYGKKDSESNSSYLFIRDNDEVTNNLDRDKIPSKLSYKHSLFITHASAFDSSGICHEIRNHLKRMTASNFDNTHDKFRWMAIEYIDNENKNGKNDRENFLTLLSAFNLKYDDIILNKDIDSNNSAVFPQKNISFKKHFNHLGDNLERDLNLFKNESAGTQKLFDLAGLLLRAFDLPVPAFIILDEIDSNFHPSLLINLIKIFNNPTINRSNTQLLFTSHDTNLMSPSIMRRDQFYLVEKNENESSRLYSLADLKGIRNDADFAKQYLSGYYGGLPVLADYKQENDKHNGETLGIQTR